MKSTANSMTKIFYLMRVLSRIYNPHAWMGPKSLKFLSALNPDIVFVASASDFQRAYDGTYIPDKLELWRHQVESIKLNSVLVLIPFSHAAAKANPKDVISIEPLVLKPLIQQKRFLALFHLLKKWRFNSDLAREPFSTYLHSQIWLNFLARTKPKLLIGIGLTDGLLGICSELGIKTIEVQHGIFSDAELRNWWQYSGDGQRYGPDLFVTWDDHYSEIASTLKINSLTVGYPFEFQGSSETEPTLRKFSNNQRPAVAVTLSCRLPGGIDPWGMIDKNMDISILKLLNQGILVRLRLHPAVQGGVIRRSHISSWLTKRYQNSEIVFPKDESILQTLNFSDVHLTVASSTVLEASYLGVPTLILQAAYLKPPAAYFSLEADQSLPDDLLSLGIIKTTNVDSILQDVEDFLRFPRKPFVNPLNISEFQQRVTTWTS